MAPITRRQSGRLAREEAADAPRAVPTGGAGPAAKRDSSASVAGSAGRVAKPEPKGRTVASRYMSAAKGGSVEAAAAVTLARPARRNEVTAGRPAVPARVPPRRMPAAASVKIPARPRQPAQQAAGVAVTPKGPAPAADSEKSSGGRLAAATQPATVAVADRRASRRTTAAAQRPGDYGPSDDQARLHATYLQWLMIEARSQLAYDAAKEAAGAELGQLERDAEAARRELADEQRKLKLMGELAGLSRWLAANRHFLAAMGTQIEGVRDAYTGFSERLGRTMRAMPIAGVHFSDHPSLVRDLEGYAGA
ncbi:hypothetical protein H4R19_007260, partial [Coemansia spiralis]